MMSNLLSLAQTRPTTEPVAVAVNLALLLIGILWLAVSATAIGRRKLYRLPDVPELPGTLTPLSLLGIAIFAIAVFMSVVGVGANLMHLDEATLKTPAGMRQMTLIQPIAQLSAAIAVLVALAHLRALPNLFYWPQARRIPILPAIGTYLLVLPWVQLVSIIVERVATSLDPDAATEKHVIFTVWQGEQDGMTIFKLVAVCSAVIVAPIAEEILFRGVLQRMLQRLTRHPMLAVLMTSLAFALIHEPWTLWPGVFILSMFLGLAYFRTGNLLVPILAHAIFNGMQLVLFMLMPSPD